MDEQASAMLTYFESGPPPQDGSYYLCFCYETDALVALQYMSSCSLYSDKVDSLRVRPNLIVCHYPVALVMD